METPGEGNPGLSEPERNRERIENERWLWGFLALTAALGALLWAGVAALRMAVPAAVKSGSDPWPIEAWAGSLALAYLLAAGLWGARRRRAESLIPLGCVILVGLVWAAFIRQCYGAKWDFDCYYRAGLAIRHGVNIYDFEALGGYRYLYSPALATVFSAAEWLPSQQRAQATYWIWSVGNYWALMVCLLLVVAALRRYRVGGSLLWPAAAAVMVCNVPLQRTLIYSQADLHVLNLILGFLLLYRRRPALAGGLLAGAALLKTSPLLLLLPAVLERRWRTVAGFAAAACLLAAASAAVVGVQPWVNFIHTPGGVRSHGLYRDNSLQSLLINVGRFAGVPAGSRSLLVLSAAITVSAVVLLIWLAGRPRYRGVFTAGPDGGFLEGAFPFFLAAMVIASPLVWEHHWIFLLLPFCLLIARARGTPLLLAGLLCYGLVYLVPTFDVFPLSYHRLAGLAWWIVIVHQLAKGGGAAGQAGEAEPISP